MRKTEITDKELNKKVKKFKAKLLRGKTIAFSMLITLAIMLLSCAILVAMGFTGEESLFIHWLYIILGSIAAICVYPGLYALIRFRYIIKLLKQVKYYEKNGILRDMVFDLETSEVVNFGDKAILSDKYLFAKNFKRIPIPCNEIYWLYTTRFRGYTSIKMGTKNNGIVYYSGVEDHVWNRNKIIEKAIENIEKRSNRELLLDYTLENEAKYKEMVGKK